MRTNGFLEDETYALVFRVEVNGIPLEGVDYVRTDKKDLLRDLALRCAHSKGITELSKAIGTKV